MHQELLELGLEKWYPGDWQPEGINGIAIFKTFEQAFHMLAMGSSNEHVQFQHQWYSNWSWMKSESSVGTFISALLDSLNDDCIQEVLKYVDFLQLIYIARLNEKFKIFVVENVKILHISPLNVGTIGVMDLRYIIEMFSGFKKIHLSLHAFRSCLGFYYKHIKVLILQVIYHCSGGELKAVHLYDFGLSEEELESIDSILQLFSARNIKIEFNS